MIFTTNIKHPKEFSLSTGKTELVSEIEAINQSIKLILLSAKGEQFGDPDFGSRLYEYLFEYSGEVLYNILRSEIVDSVNSQEPRVVISESGITFVEDGVSLKINIQYNIKYSNYSSESTVIVKKEENQWVI